MNLKCYIGPTLNYAACGNGAMGEICSASLTYVKLWLNKRISMVVMAAIGAKTKCITAFNQNSVSYILYTKLESKFWS
jgi:hypothetical protein